MRPRLLKAFATGGHHWTDFPALLDEVPGYQLVEFKLSLDNYHRTAIYRLADVGRWSRSCPHDHDIGGCPKNCECQCPSCRREKTMQNKSSVAITTRVTETQPRIKS